MFTVVLPYGINLFYSCPSQDWLESANEILKLKLCCMVNIVLADHAVSLQFMAFKILDWKLMHYTFHTSVP